MDEPCSPVIDNNLLGSGLTPAILTALLSNRLSIHRRPLVADHRDALVAPARKRLPQLIWLYLPFRLK